MTSLWGAEFEIPDTAKEAKKIINKISKVKEISKSPDKKLKSSKLSIQDKIKVIADEVNRVLGVYKENTQVIYTVSDFRAYIDKAIENGIIAIDTETNNSLDPITCKIMGLCLYTPGLKNAYIPVNHKDISSNTRLNNQVIEQDIKDQLDRLNKSNVFTIFHNGKFDYSVIKCTCDVEIHMDWDTLIGAKLLDENEKSAGLKQQYIQKIDPSIEKYSIDNLFEGIEYAVVDPEIFALYAATDAFMTYKLYLYQKAIFEKDENKNLFNLFKTVEMPVVEVLANMQLNGMDVDQTYAERLSKKYHKLLDDIDQKIAVELNKFNTEILNWRLTPEANYKPPKKTGEGTGKSKNEQLDETINLASPTQLAILLYDVLKCTPVSKKSPRSTGEEELKSLYDKYHHELFSLILQRREYLKLLSTYIDSIPELAHRWPDGRVRTHFNQYGAATGRLSSSDPLNFQNVPSDNKEIRILFCAKPGYRIIGADFSQQEPKLTAHYSQDENMINAYLEGKDLYAIIASKSFNAAYDDCLEFYPEGTEIEFEGKKIICGKKTHINKAGKQRRTYAKSILLGLLYGRGATSVGEQIGKSRQEAQEIIDSFYKAFPKVKKWIDESIENAHKYGYVEDVAGRRRRLPDIQLDKYTFIDLNKGTDFNPLLFTKGEFKKGNSNLIEKYKLELDKATYRSDIERIEKQALVDNIKIENNSGYIAQAERQAVNARVQGGAATLTKCALRVIYNDKRLKDLGAFLINTVHDEILMEVPEENSEKAADILKEDMINSAKEYVPEVPMKCDTYNVTHWYIDEYAVVLQNELKHLKEDKSILYPLENLYNNHSEMLKEDIDRLLFE